MTWVKAKPGESIENLLKRFKKVVENSGILVDYKKSRRYEKPSEAKRRKHETHIKKENMAKKKHHSKPKQLNWQWNKDRTKKIVQKAPGKFNKFKSRGSSIGKGKSK